MRRWSAETDRQVPFQMGLVLLSRQLRHGRRFRFLSTKFVAGELEDFSIGRAQQPDAVQNLRRNRVTYALLHVKASVLVSHPGFESEFLADPAPEISEIIQKPYDRKQRQVFLGPGYGVACTEICESAETGKVVAIGGSVLASLFSFHKFIQLHFDAHVAITPGTKEIVTDIAFDGIPEHRNKPMRRMEIVIGHSAESHMGRYASHAVK